MSPLHTSLSPFHLFEQVLPGNYQQQAYRQGAFARARKFASPRQLLQTLLVYCAMDFSLRACAGQFAGRQGYISDTAILKRFRRCVPWVQALAAQIMAPAQRLMEGGLRFVVIDGSTVQAPGAKGTSYRLHLAMDLIRLTLLQVKVTDDRQGESLNHYDLGEGDVALIDRGYNQPGSLVPAIDRGVDVVLRYNPHSMSLYHRDGAEDAALRRVDWSVHAKALDNKPDHVPVYLCHGNKRMDGIVHLIPLPEDKIEEARRKLRERSKQKGYTPSESALLLAGWVLIFTTLPPEVLDTESAGQLYRVRWQVELVIKRLKSLLNIDLLRAREGSLLSEVYLHGKLLYAAVLEKLRQQRFGLTGGELDTSRQETPWRLMTLLGAEVAAWIGLHDKQDPTLMADVIRAMRERPRKRRLQSLPDKVQALIQDCRSMGLSNV
jgi:hypothetical protein